MKGLKITILTIILLLNSTNLAISIELENCSLELNNDIIYVDDDNIYGPWDGTLEHPYKTINDAIYNATNGDIIFVFNGMYYENLVIDKWIILTGENKTKTIIDGEYHEFVISVLESNINIKNFTIKNSGGFKDNAGVKINSNKNILSDCIIYRTKTGIFLNNTNHNEITGCTFHTNGEGIYVKSSEFNVIKDCYLTHNSIGIHLQISERNLISNCYADTNGIGIYLNYSINNEINHCAICDNNDNQGGVFLNKCSDIDIINCNIFHNGVGIKTYSSSDILIGHCSLIWNTHFAIRARKNSQKVIIRNCEVTDNFRFGIESEGGNSKIIYNNIYNNHINGINSKLAYCDARYNWWGFITGPAFTSFGISDRVSRFTGLIRYLPWVFKYQTNKGAEWEIDDSFTIIELPDDVHKTIELPGTDTDNDGCPDWWEENWEYNPDLWDDHINLDPDEDALTNIEECFTDQYGSNPYHKDLFLEFDWTKTLEPGATNKPTINQIELMKSAFEKKEITLHVDDGSLGEGGEIPSSSNLEYNEIRDIYWDYFLNNDLDNPRKGIFHYGIICDKGPGGGFSVVGWDHLDSFAICAQLLQEGFKIISRARLIVASSMHETGHTLGLFVDDFGGIDNLASTNPFVIDYWKYRNYKSCMSYRFTYDFMDYSDGSNGRVDFNDWSNLDFNFFKNTHFEWPKDDDINPLSI